MNSTVVDSLNENTPKTIIVNEGAVYSNYGTDNEKLIGAVSGANEFDCKITTWSPSINAISKNVKGLTQIDKVETSLKCNFVEMTEDVLQMTLVAAIDKDSNTDYDVLSSKAVISNDDYLDNIALVGTIGTSQKPVIIIIKNVLVVDGISIKREHGKTNTLSVTFTPHVDPSKPYVVPFEIRYPKDLVTGS